MNPNAPEQAVLNPDFVAILACPLEEGRPPLVLESGMLVCKSCNKGFPILDGIPQLLPECAIDLSATTPEETHG
ncbi:MAG: hypothetical protein KF784_05925 [Fimbriimonadaceae bacterium]|nr:hypothetical protein [Fimbriimonadaceae bacterium]